LPTTPSTDGICWTTEQKQDQETINHTSGTPLLEEANPTSKSVYAEKLTYGEHNHVHSTVE